MGSKMRWGGRVIAGTARTVLVRGPHRPLLASVECPKVVSEVGLCILHLVVERQLEVLCGGIPADDGGGAMVDPEERTASASKDGVASEGEVEGHETA